MEKFSYPKYGTSTQYMSLRLRGLKRRKLLKSRLPELLQSNADPTLENGMHIDQKQ